MINELAIERENKRKGTRIAFIFHLGLLILAFFMTCNYEKVADNQYAVAINFEEIIPPKLEEMAEASNSNKGAEKEGAAREKADKPEEIKDQQTKTVETKRPEIKLPKAPPTPPTPTDPIVSETTMEEETDVTAAEEEDIDIDDLEPEVVPDPIEIEAEVDDEPEPEPAKESVKTKIGKILDALKTGGSDDKGNPDGDPSRADGSKGGTGEGSKGTGAGKDKSGNDGDSGSGTGGAGTGQYDGTGNGIFGRKVIKRNVNGVLSAGFENQANKKIVAKVCIARSGKVSYAEIIERETTAKMDNRKMKTVLSGIYGYEYEPNRNAPEQECGKLTIVLTNINALR
ncbi:MAG: hypothetical protein HKO66_07520 [Saprospiraceae bacterium]|nr:hypothetical protein [Bacteroidia bacterium]NNE16532.1 hypothetical protein [Saprospiraceae bacterium]NNL92063.1 hypothetical protein [Saprospiraceae bacterium]